MAEKIISTDEVRHVAKLARLHLSPAEIDKFTGQLGTILDYVNKIAQLDVSEVGAMAQAMPINNVLRDDVAEPALPLESVMQNAPLREGDFFAVPKIIGGDEDSAG